MAITKMGSKGSNVKDLQVILNKAGAKPKLKVDGIFGQLTEAQVKHFQKKFKLKADGKVGPKTMPILLNGGPLPEMTVEDFAPQMAVIAKVRNHNKMTAKSYLKLEKEMAKLAQLAAREAPIAAKSVQDVQEHWEKIHDLGNQIMRKQAEFKAIVNISPDKAKKLAKECEVLDEEMDKIRVSKITPLVKTRRASLQLIRDKMESTYKLYNSELEDLSRNKKLVLGRS